MKNNHKVNSYKYNVLNFQSYQGPTMNRFNPYNNYNTIQKGSDRINGNVVLSLNDPYNICSYTRSAV